jgi:tRNA-uridine 2-sulfurtransferase
MKTIVISDTETILSDDLQAALTGRGLAVVAMSGGVDSAVASMLFARGGGEAVAITMRLWTPGAADVSDKSRMCCGPTAYEDARRSASIAGMPHYVVNFEERFQAAVIDYFCAEYLAGRTPNPCVACNNRVKFGLLLDFARALGAKTLVTGHYARIDHDADGPRLRRAVDRAKDQSYMLAGLRPQQLAAVVTPLGEFTKEMTRAAARDFGLDVAGKPDSMDLCFVDGDYRRFILDRHPGGDRPGPLLTADGRMVGMHDGLLGYTVGQRKGIPASALGDGPWYVVRTDRFANAVIIGRREELARRDLVCDRANVVRPALLDGEGCVRGLAVCRYRGKPIPALARFDDDMLSVSLDEPVPIASPGQLLAFYDVTGEEVIGSGIIRA